MARYTRRRTARRSYSGVRTRTARFAGRAAPRRAGVRSRGRAPTQTVRLVIESVAGRDSAAGLVPTAPRAPTKAQF